MHESYMYDYYIMHMTALDIDNINVTLHECCLSVYTQHAWTKLSSHLVLLYKIKCSTYKIQICTSISLIIFHQTGLNLGKEFLYKV